MKKNFIKTNTLYLFYIILLYINFTVNTVNEIYRKLLKHLKKILKSFDINIMRAM